MTYTDAKDSIIREIRMRLAMLYVHKKEVFLDSEKVERLRNEINGMLYCLRSISSSNEFWCINYFDDFSEFGYYDDNGQWVSVL